MTEQASVCVEQTALFLKVKLSFIDFGERPQFQNDIFLAPKLKLRGARVGFPSMHE